MCEKPFQRSFQTAREGRKAKESQGKAALTGHPGHNKIAKERAL